MKVKFTKLAALLLAGAALFATGCTDYEVDIQKVDKKVDDLTSGKVATLESQVAALQATVATLETAADHKADIDKLNKAITDLETALKKLDEVEKTFWSDLRVPGDAQTLNVELEKALRLLDFIEIGKLMAYDGLNREESCGGHFREEHQTPEGEALRHDDKFSYVACWNYQGEGKAPELLKEPLNYEYIKVQTRNYKN